MSIVLPSLSLTFVQFHQNTSTVKAQSTEILQKIYHPYHPTMLKVKQHLHEGLAVMSHAFD